jgi:hypothetical protein
MVIISIATPKTNAHSCRGIQGPACCSSHVNMATRGGNTTSPNSADFKRSIKNRALVCLLKPWRSSITTAAAAAAQEAG